MKHLTHLFAFTFLLTATLTFGAEKSFVREYSYNASEADSKISARSIALVQAKELLFHELGSYLQSEFTMHSVETKIDFKEMSTSDVANITAGIAKTEILDETWNGEIYYMKVKILVDENDMKRRIDELAEADSHKSDLEKLQAHVDSAMAEITRLKLELKLAETESQKAELEAKYKAMAKLLERTTQQQSVFTTYHPQEKQDLIPQRIQIVFALDATGSMSGMISNAKDKIWAIASNLAQSPDPQILEFGLVHYRDRGDDYITQRTQLTGDIDKFYADLMKVSASGGGDGPESVNQAIHESISSIHWAQDTTSIKTVFLIGDAPPHMDYANDAQYPKSCMKAIKKDIVINTILCGSDGTTEQIWRTIASTTGGDFLKLSTNGNRVTVSSGYDKEMSDLAKQLDQTRMAYGDTKAKEEERSRIQNSMSIGAASTSEINAKRAVYNITTTTGRDNYFGNNDLVQAYDDDASIIEEMDEEQLPESLQGLSVEQKKAELDKMVEDRRALEAKIKTLNKKRTEDINTKIEASGVSTETSFNSNVIKSINKHARKKNSKYKAACHYW